ncbi:MAG: tRNA dihydrouridine synthase DusB [Bacteroidota bacterium]|nr:tRNA dihydrouridine synthase DusB [Bacteroidota bacterium]
MVKIGTIALPEFPLLLAPMEDVSDPPFRLVCKENGADLLFTEFISSRGLVRETEKCRRRLDFFAGERPIGIQIFGGDERSMGLAAAIVEGTKPDFLDINFGCPVKGIVNSGAGAGVLRDLDLMVRLTQACVNATSLPVTVKTRLGWDEESKNIGEVAERLQDAGIAALTIHGRTRCQLYKGSADWTLIAEVKNNPRIHIPIFGNGDISSPEMALEYKERYGVDGMMIGRAAIGNPWIFREIRHYLQTGELLPSPGLEERVSACRKHLLSSVAWKGPIAGIRDMRRHYVHYLRGVPDGPAYRKRLVLLETAEEIGSVLDEVVAANRGLRFQREPVSLVNYHEHCAL